MLNDKEPIEKIVKYTGLRKKEIEKIKDLFIEAKISELEEIIGTNHHHELFNSDDAVGNEKW
ncbi:MAG: hypothetical protein RCO49_09505 [Rickettsia endosymbiont of Argas persicus]